MRIATCVFAVLMTGYAQGDVIVTEDFESYTAGTSLNGLNGGTGFAGAWSGSGFSTANNGSGNRASGQSGFSLGNRRGLGTAATTIFSSNAGEIWLSFDFAGNAGADSFAGFNLYQGTTERVLIGKNGINSPVTGHTNWMIARDGGNGDISGVAFDQIKTGVVRFNLAAGNGGSADLWVGASGSIVDTSVAADASISSLTLGGIDTVAFRGNGASTLDSIKFGTTAFDVGAAAVPEPSGLLVLGLGSVIGCVWRRRRKSVVEGGSSPPLQKRGSDGDARQEQLGAFQRWNLSLYTTANESCQTGLGLIDQG